MNDIPPLSVVARRVAHDVRGPVGVIVAALHEIEEALAGLGDAAEGKELQRLVEMARRGTRKLERTAFTLDAIGALPPPAVSHVDLQPMVKTAIDRMQIAERRPQVAVNVVSSPETTLRVTVAPPLFTHALEELFGYAIRKSAREVRVMMMSSSSSSSLSSSAKASTSSASTSPTSSSTSHEASERGKSHRTTSLVITMIGVDVVPASAVPFEEPLGLAAHLLSAQHVSLAIHKKADGVEIMIDVPSP